VRTVSLDGRAVTSAHGLGVAPHAAMADVERTDIVIVSTSASIWTCSSSPTARSCPGFAASTSKARWWSASAWARPIWPRPACSTGRIATTHWALARKFAARYPNVRWRPEQFVTEDNRLLCSGGVFASVDISLYLVEKLCGHEIAVQTAKSLLLPMPRIHQSGYAMHTVSQAHGDERIREVEAYLQTNFQKEIATNDLARRAGLGERTFVRHFKAATGQLPAGYVQALRIQAAKTMLERDAKPIQAISYDVGYDDVAFFRSLFKRITSMTPTEYRAHFAPLSVRGEAALEAP
jgi:transcriptional regulator GlxA family with amidase domain